MTIPWATTLDAVAAALAGATPIDEQIGKTIRARLAAWGPPYNDAFPPGSPSVLVERAAHVAWRAVMVSAALDVNEVVHVTTGAPLPPPSGNPAADYNDACRRAREALATTAWGTRLLQDALAARVPLEPPFYVDEFYTRISRFESAIESFSGEFVPDTFGNREERLVFIINEAELWLEVQ